MVSISRPAARCDCRLAGRPSFSIANDPRPGRQPQGGRGNQPFLEALRSPEREKQRQLAVLFAWQSPAAVLGSDQERHLPLGEVEFVQKLDGQSSVDQGGHYLAQAVVPIVLAQPFGGR